MDIKIGLIVKAKAGRDKNKFFVVSKIIDSNYVLICDGKTHKLNNMKKKNIKHLQFTNSIIDEITTDRMIRETLKGFNLEDI